MPQEPNREELNAPAADQSRQELPGRRLREQREQNQLSREEVGHHLRLDVQLIKALEEDDYARLPSAAYICGYLRSYARLLKLPEDEIVKSYSHGQEINAAIIPENVRILPKKTINKSIVRILILAVVVLLAGGLYFLAEQLGLLNFIETQISGEKLAKQGAAATSQLTQELKIPDAANSSTEQESQLQEVTAEQAPAETENDKTTGDTDVTAGQRNPAAVEAEDESQSAQIQQPKTGVEQNKSASTTPGLRMHFTDDSWVEVTDVSGNRLLYRLAEKNSDINLDGEPPYTVLLGNAPAVEVYYKGKLFDHKRYQRDDVAYFKIGSQ